MIAGALKVDRERAIGEALKAASAESLEEAMAKAAGVVRAAMEEKTRQYEELRRDTESIEARLVEGRGLTEKDSDGQSADGLWKKWSREVEGSEVLREILRPLSERIELHESIPRLDAAGLLAIIEAGAMTDAGFDVGLAAWERLFESVAEQGVAWPGTVADLKRAGDITERVRGFVERGLKSGAVKSAKLEWMAALAGKRWVALAEGLMTGDAESRSRRAEDLVEALKVRSGFGFASDASKLPPMLRLNIALLELDELLGKVATVEETKKASKRFRDLVSGLGAGASGNARVTKLLAGFARDIDPEKRETDVRTLGPGGVVGKERAVVDGDFIRFTIYDGEVEFARVGEGENAAYIARDEAAVGLVAAIFEKLGEPDKEMFRDGDYLSPNNNPDEMNSWKGPLPWRWDKSGKPAPLVASVTWVDVARAENTLSDGQRNVVEGLFAGALGAKLPPGMGEEPGRNKGTMPMTRLTGPAAEKLCKAIGCRLPTVEEWAMALAAAGPSAAGADTNLADQTFKRQSDFVAGEIQGMKRFLPAEGSFAPQDGNFVPAFDDGTLWFWPVGRGRPGKFRNLVGNVAEWVRDPGTDAFAIMGGSAMSPVSLAPGTAVKEKFGAFWDVGFRPCFSAAGASSEPLWVTARKLVETEIGRLPVVVEP